MAKETVLYLVIPCFNEGGQEGALPLTAPLFLAELERLISQQKIADASRILFVDDGSNDGTWEAIENLAMQDGHFAGIRLSRNRGHQNALLAGLMEARGACDVAISLDCDGQDDLGAIEKMIDEYDSGSDIVYGVRSKRDSDTAFKRWTAETFYKLLQAMDAEVVYNHADYRLMSNRALDALSEFGETNLYLRGIVPQIGFPSATVEYERAERVAGESHYPLKKMIALALNGITSLSIKPLRFVSALGVIFSLLGIAGIIWAVVAAILGATVSGWASLMCVFSLIGGIQLFCLGVIGEYVGKIYLETKKRPRYIVSERTESDWTSIR